MTFSSSWDKGYPLYYEEKLKQASQDTSSNASDLAADELEKPPEALKQIAEGRHLKDIKVILLPLRSGGNLNTYTHKGLTGAELAAGGEIPLLPSL